VVKLLIAGLAASLLFINLTRSVLAQSATSPATPIEAADQEKIKGIREAVKEEVQRKIAARQTRGYAGTVNSLTETELTLVTKRGEKKVTLKETTQMVNKEKLKEGAYAVVIGLVEGNDVEAKRVVITAAPKIDKRVAVAGRVIDISPEEQLLTVKNEKSGEVVTVEIKEEKQFSQIKADDWLVAIGIPAENDEKMLTAKTVLTKTKI
jgi:hypothetical protein